MMRTLFKILIVLLAVAPIWLTLAAFADTDSARSPSVFKSYIPSDQWKARINSELLKITDRKIQVSEMLMTNEALDDSLLNQHFNVEVSELRPQAASQLSLRFVDSEGRLERLVRIPAKLYVQEAAVVATRTLAPGTRLAETDLRVEWKEVTSFRTSVKSTATLIGRTIQNLIREGDAVSEASLQKEVLVAKGDRVKIAVLSKGIQLTLVGVAQENGQKGQTIRVLNADSKKEIFATVTEAKIVEVRL